MKRVLTIAPKTISELKGRPQESKLRVCAYCRVSSGSEEQQASYETQVDYYTQYIKTRPEWDFAGVYADSGISGTGRIKRMGFNRMVKDCEAGKIDLIITKSISRFARNTADCLETVRFLKEIGVAVYFERENINTMDAEGEFVLSVMSSLAQEESRSFSENLRWSVQKRFRQGKVRVNTKRFLGYNSDGNGRLVINPKEAKIVKQIFSDYLAGKSMGRIAKVLQAEGLETVTGLSRWQESTIRGILSNEKYCGDVVLQKTFTEDYLTHKKRKNRGQLPMFHIQGNHTGIITKEEFDQVQLMIAERAAEFGNFPKDRDKYARTYVFSGKIECGNCGAVFKRRIWNSKASTRQVVWQCGTYIKQGKKSCGMKAMDEVTLKKIFVRAVNRLIENKDDVLRLFMVNVQKVLNGESNTPEKLDIDIQKVTERMKQLVRLQIKGVANVELFQNEYEELKLKLQNLRDVQVENLKERDRGDEIVRRTKEIEGLIRQRNKLLTEFDEQIYDALVEKVVVKSPTHLCFILRNGQVIEEQFVKKKGIHGLVEEE